MHDKLLHVINTMVDIPDEQQKKIAKIFAPRIIRKNQFFIEAGQVPREIGFNIAGLFRYYYIDDHGNEYTKHFCPENNFILSYRAMVLGCGSGFYIQAMEDSNILLTEFDRWTQLLNDHVCWHILTEKLLEKVYIIKEKREKELLLDNAETRYSTFVKENPGLDARIKQYQIASYLGITPVALSRIKARHKNLNLG